MAIPLYAAIANTGQIRQLDVRGTPDDYDGSVPMQPYLVSNPVTPAGSAGWARLRRFVQSGVGGTGEQVTVTAWPDGSPTATSTTRAFAANGALPVPMAQGATQHQVQVTLVGVQGTELGSAELWLDNRRTVRSADGS